MNETIKTLKELNDSITANCRKVSMLKIEKEIQEDYINNLEASVQKDVAFEQNENGKAMYSNESLRSAEMVCRLRINKEYIDVRKNLIKLSTDIAQLIDTIESEKRLFRILRDEIKLLTKEE